MAALRAPRRLGLCWSRLCLCLPAWKRQPALFSGGTGGSAFSCGGTKICFLDSSDGRANLAGKNCRRGIWTSKFVFQSVGKGGGGDRGGRGGRGGGGGGDMESKNSKDGEDDDMELGLKRRGKQRTGADERPAFVPAEPMDYYFSGIPPDHKAACLSDESKEKMWLAYQSNPTLQIIDTLAETYKIRKQRVHAILWLKDIEKEEAAARGKPLDDDIEKEFEQIYGTYETADNERHYTMPSTRPDFEVQEEGWKGTVKAEGQSLDEVSAKEERMLVEEFVQRMNFNKMQIARIKNMEKSPHTRPPEGWSYLVEELGQEGKRGRRGGRRFVAQPDGRHRGLNDVEKMFLKRETVRPRRRLTPK